MKFHRSMRRGVIAAVVAGALVAPAGAFAHVTIQPTEMPAGGFARFDVRVPNEEEDASTEKVEVQMPPGFYSVRFEPKEGWSFDVKMKKLATPVKDSFGEERTEEVDTVTISADKGNKGIEPGQFQDFGLSGGPIPGKAGQSLSFPSLQTYSNGEVVRWIDKDPEAERPAPQVTLVAAEEEGGAATPPAEDKTAENAASKEDVDDKASKTLGIAALIVGGLGLVIGIAAFAASRRKPAA
jgi:uncharacterized protein